MESSEPCLCVSWCEAVSPVCLFVCLLFVCLLVCYLLCGLTFQAPSDHHKGSYLLISTNTTARLSVKHTMYGWFQSAYVISAWSCLEISLCKANVLLVWKEPKLTGLSIYLSSFVLDCWLLAPPLWSPWKWITLRTKHWLVQLKS